MFLKERCPYCDGIAEFELHEVYPEHRAFQIITCCEWSHDAWLNDMRCWSRQEWKDFFWREAAIDIRSVCPSVDWCSGTAWPIDWGLRLGEVPQKVAKDFIRSHHRHLPKPPPQWKWGHGCFNGDDLVGVAWVGGPLARMIDHTTTVEVNRLCVLDQPGLVWNACSMLYGAAAREAKRRGYEKIITYVLESEDGTTLKAAGWTREWKTKKEKKGWDRPSRRRSQDGPRERKWRWARCLR